MAKEYLSNLPVPGSVTPISTLEAELKTGEKTAKLVTALSVGFRTEGIQFRLICGSEILLVTKVEESGKKITVTRAAEESSEANHASGASLYNFITKGALEKSGEEREKTYTAKAPLKLTGSEFEIEVGGITESYLGSEAVTNAKVKKESLEPNRLEKEKLTSGQIKERGIAAASLAIPWKVPVAYATAAALPSSEAESGELLFSTGHEELEVDGANPIVGMRILVKNQAKAENDGIYKVVKTGSGSTIWELKRTTDANTTAELQDAVTVVEKGKVNEGSQWTQTATVTTVGTTAQVWTGDIGPVTTVAIAYRKAAFSIPSNKITAVPVDTVTDDPGGHMSTAKGCYVVPQAGYYAVSGNAYILTETVTTSLEVTSFILVNGAERVAGASVETSASSAAAGAVFSGIVLCVAGDEIQIGAYQIDAAKQEERKVQHEISGRNILCVVRVA